MAIDTAARAEALALRTALRSAPDARTLVALAETGLGELSALEREGGDEVGTDAYSIVVSDHAEYVALLTHHDASVRAAAGYLLALLLPPAAQTLPALEQAAQREQDDSVAACLWIAAARLRTAVNPPERPRTRVELDPRAEGASSTMRVAVALAQVLSLPPLSEISEELDDVLALAKAHEIAAGPWGGGRLSELIEPIRKRLWVRRTPAASMSPEPAASNGGEPRQESLADQPVDDPYTQQRPHRAPPRVELPGLYTVDWSSLEHAYGAAAGVPGMIDALSSPDPQDRDWGIEALEACIHHQGSVFSASTAAVPFLVRLTDHGELEHRERILDLLCGIAVHQPEGCLVQGAYQWRSEAYEAVKDGTPVFLERLADADARVRTSAAFVLSFLEPAHADALPRVRAALEAETDRRARSSLLLALGYLSRYLESKEDRELLSSWLGDECELVRTSAAIALAQMDGYDTSAEARAVLDQCARGNSRVRGHWPWAQGDLRRFALVIRQSIKTIDDVLADFERAANANDEREQQVAANKALGMLFRDDAHDVDRLWRPSELDATRTMILRFLVDITQSEDHGRALLPSWEFLNRVGLPCARAAMTRLLGDDPGPVDEEITLGDDTRPVWQWIHSVLVGHADREALLAVISSRTPSELLSLVEDALSAPHWCWKQRRPVDYGVDGSADEANDFSSRFCSLAAEMLALAGQSGIDWAHRVADEQAPLGSKRAVVRSTIAALVLAREAEAAGRDPDARFDALVAFDQPPNSTYRLALLQALAALSEERRVALVGDLEMWSYTSYRDPRGEVRRWKKGKAWQYLDFLPSTRAAELVLSALAEWQRHRAAGDDPHAEPVGQHVESSIESQPGQDGDFPAHRVVHILAAAGTAWIDRALHDRALPDRSLLEEARRVAAG